MYQKTTRRAGIECTGGSAGTNRDPALFEADRQRAMSFISPLGCWRDPRKDQQHRTRVSDRPGGWRNTNGAIMRSRGNA